MSVSHQIVNFDRVLLHRKESRTIYMRNPTLLPMSWRLSGLEALGDEFTASADSGTIEPKSELALELHMRAMRPSKPNQKRGIKLEVFDMDNVIGLVQTENIQVVAEAYDVALDMSFPKGEGSGLDFGAVKVFDETRLQIVLRNKGPYEIAYRCACPTNLLYLDLVFFAKSK